MANDLYRVKFKDKTDEEAYEVVVEYVESSEFLGLISLEGFIFSEHSQQVIIPSEDKARKRFAQVKRLHVPYHNVISIEEFTPASNKNLKSLPFLKKAQDPIDLPEPT